MAHSQDSPIHGAQTRFLHRSMAAPMLTREHEFRLASAWRNGGDEASLQALTVSYIRLVVAIASRYRHYGLSMGDLIQEGTVGLLQAAVRFEPERQVRFSTYATWWIRAAIQDYILRNWSIVRTGTTSSQKSLFFKLRRLRAQIEDASGRSLDHRGRQRIAEALALPLAEIEMMESRLNGGDQSLNAPIAEAGGKEPLDELVDVRPTPEDNTIARRATATRRWVIGEALAALSVRERRIITARRLSAEGATLAELGGALGVSKERVRQIEQRALAKMKVAVLGKVDRAGDLMDDR